MMKDCIVHGNSCLPGVSLGWACSPRALTIQRMSVWNRHCQSGLGGSRKSITRQKRKIKPKLAVSRKFSVLIVKNPLI